MSSTWSGARVVQQARRDREARERAQEATEGALRFGSASAKFDALTAQFLVDGAAACAGAGAGAAAGEMLRAARCLARASRDEVRATLDGVVGGARACRGCSALWVPGVNVSVRTWRRKTRRAGTGTGRGRGRRGRARKRLGRPGEKRKNPSSAVSAVAAETETEKGKGTAHPTAVASATASTSGAGAENCVGGSKSKSGEMGGGAKKRRIDVRKWTPVSAVVKKPIRFRERLKSKQWRHNLHDRKFGENEMDDSAPAFNFDGDSRDSDMAIKLPTKKTRRMAKILYICRLCGHVESFAIPHDVDGPPRSIKHLLPDNQPITTTKKLPSTSRTPSPTLVVSRSQSPKPVLTRTPSPVPGSIPLPFQSEHIPQLPYTPEHLHHIQFLREYLPRYRAVTPPLPITIIQPKPKQIPSLLSCEERRKKNTEEDIDHLLELLASDDT
ncbi:hypothetical protein Pelo_5219 [Pelomyxa schiedti]|nr:hypothetical protein Pelo_5219 [Pelomyxa schiedti]